MAASLAARRMLAARRPPPVPRRRLQDRPSGVAAEIAKLGEAERAILSKHLDALGEELQSKLVQGVDAYLQRPTFHNDQGNLNRVLTFCRVPKGERREKLIWRCSLAGMFITSWAVGRWKASRCVQYYYEHQKRQEETANHAA